MELDSKICRSCGRRFEWRKQWAKDWDQVQYCSTACRKHGVTAHDRDLEHRILDLLGQRAATATICPSDVARQLGDGWEQQMEPVRRAARRLVAAGEVEITQHGSVVDPSSAKGPIRIRRVRHG